MFWVLSNKVWIERFNAGPYKFFIFPAIAISGFINALIECYDVYHAPNKNLLTISSLVTTVIGTFGSVVANFGAVIAALYFNAAFPLGVYFILITVSAALIFNLSLCVIHLITFNQALTASKMRIQYKQSAAFHLFYTCMLSAIFSALMFTMVIPMVTIFPALAIAFFITDLLWSVVFPKSAKEWLQVLCGFSEENNFGESNVEYESEHLMVTKQDEVKNDSLRFFQPTRRQDTVHSHLKAGNKTASSTYLQEEIRHKKSHLEKVISNYPNDLKHTHKLTVLNEIENYLTRTSTLTDKELECLCQENFLSRQSFFSMAQGEVDDIIEATKLHMNTP